MNYKDYIAIGGVIAPVATAIIVLALTNLQIFHPSPDFRIRFEPMSNSTEGFRVTVENVGSAQARNVNVNIVATHSVGIHSIFCPEGNGTATESAVVWHMTFAKMSTNMQCQMNIRDVSGTNSSVSKTYYFGVSADDASGEQLTVNIAPKEPEESETASGLSQVALLGIIATMTSVALSSSTWLYKRIRERQERTERLKERETGLESEIKEATEELSFLERSTSGQQNIPPAIQQRMQYLEDRITRLGESLAQTRGMVQTSEDTRVHVGDFFTKWALLERDLNKLGSKYGLSSMGIEWSTTDRRRPNIASIVQFLYSKEVLSRNFLEIFEPLRNFRNQFAHGVANPTENELKEKITQLEKLLEETKSRIPTSTQS